MTSHYRQRPHSTVPLHLAKALRRRLTRQAARPWVSLRRCRAAGPAFRRQCPIGPDIVDFACLKARLVVEVDGGQHGFDENAARDHDRDRHLERLGFEVLRFWNHQVDLELDVVMDTILAHLAERIERTRAVPPP
ncbi:MAG: endonuclease domain-containing protein [Salinarimonas sp.]